MWFSLVLNRFQVTSFLPRRPGVLGLLERHPGARHKGRHALPATRREESF